MPANRVLSLAVILATGLASASAALERTPARASDAEQPWVSAQTHQFSYYNTCTGWWWIWSNWADGEAVGVIFDLPPGGGAGTYCPEYVYLTKLRESWVLVGHGAPAGYGFTGVISVKASECGATLASQPFLPARTVSWHVTDWGGMGLGGQPFLEIRWAAPDGFLNPAGLYSDHPNAGATGPAACGTCYPTTRVTQTRHLGTDGAYCPGVGLSDGLCDVELLASITMECFQPVVGIQGELSSETWGRIKSLYR